MEDEEEMIESTSRIEIKNSKINKSIGIKSVGKKAKLKQARKDTKKEMYKEDMTNSSDNNEEWISEELQESYFMETSEEMFLMMKHFADDNAYPFFKYLTLNHTDDYLESVIN